MSNHVCGLCKTLSKEQQTQVLCSLICMNSETFLSTWIFFILLTILSKEIIKQILPKTFNIFNYIKNNYLDFENVITKKRGTR